MSSQSSAPLTTLLMFVPLVAVPALAIFGIPEFAPATSMSRTSSAVADAVIPVKNHDATQQPNDNLISPIKNSVGGAANAIEPIPSGGELGAGDPFQKEVATQPTTGAPDDGVETWNPPPNVLRDWEPHPVGGESAVTSDADRSPKEPGEFDPSAAASNSAKDDRVALGEKDASPFRPVDEDEQNKPTNADSFSKADWAQDKPAASTKSEAQGAGDKPAEKFRLDSINLSSGEQTAETPANNTPATGKRTDSLTWRTAVQKLNKLGVHDFQLQPSDDPNLFHFSCSYAEPDRPRISHRFEAEAEEPLHAVQKVLAQLESMSKKP